MTENYYYYETNIHHIGIQYTIKAIMTKILLVEDDAPLLEVLQSILEAEGYEVFPAVNGKQALELFLSSQAEFDRIGYHDARNEWIRIA